jgi:aldoxime dehydratase
MSKEVHNSSDLVCLASSPRHLPPDWKPPASAWAANFAQQTTPVIMAYFGIQLGERDRERRDSLPHEFFACADGPDNLESAKYIDRSGCHTLISSAYWTNPASYERWNIQSGFDA